MRRLALIVIALALIATACADDEGGGPTTAPDATSTTIEPTTSTSTTITPTTAPTTTEPTTTTTAPPSTTTEPPATTSTTVPIEDLDLSLEVVAAGFTQPVFVAAPPGDPRLFVVDQPGTVWVIDGDDPAPFLDITDRVGFGGEQGLFAVAFAPDYAESGLLYVDYTGTDGDTRVSEFSVTDDPNRADPASERVLLTVDQPAGNHNGGMVAFGPDGMLWVAFGDGGGSDDRFGNGQRPDTLLGTLVRIDPSGDPYAIPVDNPFAGGGDGAPEVWVYGLRNPWRFSFDGDRLFIADVGQNTYEEISVLTHPDDAGANLGWPIMEGLHCFSPSSGCDTTGLVLPVFEYDHDEGCSITGGYVYRGSAIPELDGHYFYSDYCTEFLRSIVVEGDTVVSRHTWTRRIPEMDEVLSFGTDAAGELYVVANGIGDDSGAVARIVAGD